MAWNGKDAWIESIRRTLGSIDGHTWRLDHRYSASTDMLLAVARVGAACADHDTGRSLTTSNRFVAMVLGCSEKTVQRCRVMLTDAGFYTTATTGRYLTTTERRTAYETHGCHQRRAASVRALTTPKRLAVENVHLPRRGQTHPQSPVLKRSPTRACARAETAPRPATKKNTLQHDWNAGSRHPRPIIEQRFVAELVRRMPWLARTKHIGAVSSMLQRVGIDPHRWTISTLLAAVEIFRAEHRIDIPDPSTQRDPLAYFAWLLTQAIDPTAETPTEKTARLRHHRITTQAAERQTETQRIAAIDWDEVTRIIQQSNQDTKTRNRVRRDGYIGGSKRSCS